MESRNQNANPSIDCNVSACEHHSKPQNKCTLNSIQVGCSGPTTNSTSCTECDSFKKK